MPDAADRRIPGLYAIVPAGGAGTRLWPLSRAAAPKFLLDLAGTGRSLLQDTVARLEPLVGAQGVLVVTGVDLAAPVTQQLPELSEDNLLLEPSPRDSTAAIALAAAVVLRRDSEATIGSFAADHVIGDVAALHAAVHEAVVVAQAGYVVTLGVRPTYAATAFGYIRTGRGLEVADAPSARVADRFVEKPDAETAAEYVRSGAYRWNAGMFVSRADVLLAHLARHQPVLHDAVSRIADAWSTPERDRVLAERWPTVTRIAIDYSVAEPVAAEGGIAVIPVDLDWDDIGDVLALSSLLASDEDVQVLGDRARVLAVDASGLVAQSGRRTVTLLGVRDVAVLDTEDAVLVTCLADSQRVKDLVTAWRQRGRVDLL